MSTQHTKASVAYGQADAIIMECMLDRLDTCDPAVTKTGFEFSGHLPTVVRGADGRVSCELKPTGTDQCPFVDLFDTQVQMKHHMRFADAIQSAAAQPHTTTTAGAHTHEHNDDDDEGEDEGDDTDEREQVDADAELDLLETQDGEIAQETTDQEAEIANVADDDVDDGARDRDIIFMDDVRP